MTQKLVDRYDLGEVPSKGIWFNYGDYSVLNCGKLMESHPMIEAMVKAGAFVGWEALKDNDTIRAESLKELLNKLN